MRPSWQWQRRTVIRFCIEFVCLARAWLCCKILSSSGHSRCGAFDAKFLQPYDRGLKCAKCTFTDLLHKRLQDQQSCDSQNQGGFANDRFDFRECLCGGHALGVSLVSKIIPNKWSLNLGLWRITFGTNGTPFGQNLNAYVSWKSNRIQFAKSPYYQKWKQEFVQENFRGQNP